MQRKNERRLYKVVENFLREEKGCKSQWGSRGTRQDVKLGERLVDVVGLAINRKPQRTPTLRFDHHAVEIKDRILDHGTLDNLIGKIENLRITIEDSPYITEDHGAYLYAAVPWDSPNNFHERLKGHCQKEGVGYLEISSGPHQSVTQVVPPERRRNPFVTFSNKKQRNGGTFVAGIRQNTSLASLIPEPNQLWSETIGRWREEYDDERAWENSITYIRDPEVQETVSRLVKMLSERSEVMSRPRYCKVGSWEFSSEGRRIKVWPTRAYANVIIHGREAGDKMPGGLSGDILFRIQPKGRVKVVVSNRAIDSPWSHAHFLEEIERWIVNTT